MLKIHLDKNLMFDEETQEFIETPEQNLVLEHSLRSVAKWEKKWKKSFFKDERTNIEILSYISCMSLKEELSVKTLMSLSNEDVQKINDYISKPQTGVKSNKKNTPSTSNTYQTHETIYAAMVTLRIPFDPVDKWHMSNLFALIDAVADIQQPKKKMSPEAVIAQNRRIAAKNRRPRRR